MFLIRWLEITVGMRLERVPSTGRPNGGLGGHHDVPTFRRTIILSPTSVALDVFSICFVDPQEFTNDSEGDRVQTRSMTSAHNSFWGGGGVFLVERATILNTYIIMRCCG